MNDHEMAIMEKLGEISATTAATNATVTALREDMNRRITELEDDVKHERRWQKYYNYGIVPAVAAIHAVVRKLGIQI